MSTAADPRRALVEALTDLLRCIERETDSPAVDTFDLTTALAEADDVLDVHRASMPILTGDALGQALDRIGTAVELDVTADPVALPRGPLDLERYAEQLLTTLLRLGVHLVPADLR